jgi:hypothetical protein
VGDHSDEHTDRTNNRISATDRAAVHALVAALEAKVRAEAPPELREEATELVDELENAILAEVPGVRRMAFIRDWFSAHLPRLAVAVSGRPRHRRVPQHLRHVRPRRAHFGDQLTTRS